MRLEDSRVTHQARQVRACTIASRLRIRMAGDGFDGGKACASDPRNQRRSVPREVYGTLEDVPDLPPVGISLPDSNGAATRVRTVGARAVNHFASLETSMELLQPVPDAIGELLEYTTLILYQRLACFTETLGRSQSGSFPSSSASSLLTEDLARDPAESVFAWLFN